MNRTRQSGFSLVELMVALGISLLLFAGAVGIYLSSKNTYVDNDRMSRLQETGRIALDVIQRDLRNSGYHACVRVDSARFFNVLNSSATMRYDFRFPVVGWDANAGAWSTGGGAAAFDSTVTPNIVPGTDVIVARGPVRENNNLRLNGGITDPTAALTVFPPAAGMAPLIGDLMMVTDCEYTSVFQVTGYATNVIQHAASGSPGNSTTSLQAAFSPNGQVVPVRSVVYWIGQRLVAGSGTTPFLYRRVNAGNAEELLEGVEQLQLLYGYDANLDGVVDRYLNARDVPNWSRVIAVQIAMLVRTPSEDNTMVDKSSYTLLDAPAYVPTPDRRQRALFQTTVTLRNETL